MRPKYLELEGLHSFRDKQGIDFETLGEAGLFGIFGPTGSGKSTILDAITLALYGRVDRADRGTQGIIHANSKRLRVSFTFELRKGRETKTYRVERVYTRKKDTDSSTADIARLIELTDAGELPLADKNNEVTAQVEERIGLNHSDFTKAVVLPQNKFQDFLMLNTADRKRMLERIFYLEEYGQQLNDKVKSKLDGLKQRQDIVKGALTALGNSSEETVEKAEKDLASAGKEKASAIAHLKAVEKKYQEARETWELMKDGQILQKREQDWLASKSEMDEKKAALEKAMQADALMPMLKKSEETAGKLEKIQADLSIANELLPKLNEDLKQLEGQYQSIRWESEQKQPILLEAKTRLKNALSFIEQVGQLKSELSSKTSEWKATSRQMKEQDEIIRRAREKLEELQKEQTEKQIQLADLSVDPAYRHAMQSGATMEYELEKTQKDAQSTAEKLQQQNNKITLLTSKEKESLIRTEALRHDLDKLIQQREKHMQSSPGNRSEIMESMKTWNQIDSICANLQRLKEEVLRIGKKEVDLWSEKKKLEGSRKQETARLDEAYKTVEYCKSNLAGKEESLERHTAYLLARNLSDDHPCPVCGSAHHPQPANRQGVSDLQQIEEEIAKAKEQLEQAQENKQTAERIQYRLDEQIRILHERLDQARLDAAEKKEEYEQKATNLPKEFKHLQPHELKTRVDEGQAIDEATLKSIDNWEQGSQSLQDQLQKKKDVLSKLDSEREALLAEIRVNQETLMQLEGEYLVIVKTQKEKTSAFDAFLQSWPNVSPSKELKRIAQNDRAYQTCSNQHNQLQDSVSKKRKKLEALTELRSKLASQAASLETEGRSLREQVGKLDNQIKEAAPSGNVKEEIDRIDQRLADMIQAEKRNREQFDVLWQKYQQKATWQSNLMKEKEIYTIQYEHEKEELARGMQQKGFTNQTEVKNAVRSTGQQQALEQILTFYRQTGESLKGHRQVLENKLKGRTMDEEEWNKALTEHQDAMERRDKSLASFEVEKNNYDKLMVKHNQWKACNSVLKQLSEKIVLLTQIYDLLKGDRGRDNSFLDFIAEERLRYVAAKASEILEQITRYKYALQLDGSEGFVIRDNRNGGVSRRASSLSGGETFLTSLSLALALSEQIQLKGQSPLEFFFLDEGFGTLDRDLLDLVMDSLERLSTNERMIGLISHVQELKQRIPRRLMLKPPNAQGQGTRVYLERA